MKDILSHPEFSPGRHRPLGDTDSEWAFCALLARMESLWTDSLQSSKGVPTPSARFEVATRFAGDLRKLGMAIFLYSDGEFVFAHAHRRHQPDGRIAAPGLHTLQRHCAGVSGDARSDGVALDAGADGDAGCQCATD